MAKDRHGLRPLTIHGLAPWRLGWLTRGQLLHGFLALSLASSTFHYIHVPLEARLFQQVQMVAGSVENRAQYQ